MNLKQIKSNLKKHGFKLAGELLGLTESTKGNPMLEWDMIDEEVPAIYLILWGDGDSKTGKAEKFAQRLRHYQYWLNQGRPADDEFNRLLDEIKDRNDVQVYYKPVYEMRWCDILQKEILWSPNLFELEKFYRDLFGSKYK